MINFEEIIDSVGANEIILVEKIGSKLYGINNPRDEDVLVVVDKKEKIKSFFSEEDVFVFSIDEYNNSLSQQYFDAGCLTTKKLFLSV